MDGVRRRLQFYMDLNKSGACDDGGDIPLSTNDDGVDSGMTNEWGSVHVVPWYAKD